jgi:hypothetical protein
MNAHDVKTARTAVLLTKADPSLPAFIVTGPTAIVIRAGTVFAGHSFRHDTQLPIPAGGFEIGTDYGVAVDPLRIEKLPVQYTGWKYLGGFHFAPGGNARGRAGGDSTAAINPCSCWDLNFRPFPDPRGAVFVPGKKCWIDIYPLGVNHTEDGTSRFGVTIADGNDPPRNPAGGYFSKLDYDTAVAVMAHHGKTLANLEELYEATRGVTEYSAAGSDPKITGLDAPRTSNLGVMQASGNIWVWCNDNHKRPSFFGGSWWSVGYAGSRYASVGFWRGNSDDDLGARARSDHLQLA